MTVTNYIVLLQSIESCVEAVFLKWSFTFG